MIAGNMADDIVIVPGRLGPPRLFGIAVLPRYPRSPGLSIPVKVAEGISWGGSQGGLGKSKCLLPGLLSGLSQKHRMCVGMCLAV